MSQGPGASAEPPPSQGEAALPRDTLDLTHEDTGPPESQLEPGITQYNPERTREYMRGVLAFTLVAILGVLSIGALMSLWFSKVTSQDLESMLGIVLTPIVGLVGAVTGFYYGGGRGSGTK